MPLMKRFLLWCSRNRWMAGRFPRFPFVRKAVKRFMPGETLDAALAEAVKLKEQRIGTVLTFLGENIKDLPEADLVRDHYLGALQKIARQKLPSEISVKLTQLGLDIASERALEHVRELAKAAKASSSFVWIDMEGSAYVDATLALYRQVRPKFDNVGLCLQAYLYRTEKDLQSLLPLVPSIRLVKGAYRESRSIAMPRKSDVDRNYLALARKLIDAMPQRARRVVLGTHDLTILEAVKEYVERKRMPRESFEIHMLYGIKQEAQRKLAGEGYRLRTLISYGTAWFPWYMRRLAERPANVWFMVRGLFG